MDGPIVCLIVAAGSGERAGEGLPKQFRPIQGEAMLSRAAAPFLAHPEIGRVAVVIQPRDADLYRRSVEPHAKLTAPIAGGSSRQESARLGLEAFADDPPRFVLIHDAARPFVDAGTISRVIAALDEVAGALPGLPVSDTVKSVENDGRVTATVPRDGLFLAQTPQGFHFPLILDAHRRAARDAAAFTDDAAVAAWAGMDVRVVAGAAENRKLTSAADIQTANTRPGDAKGFTDIRVGSGYDVHPFGDGDHVMLCGVAIQHGRGLQGHSDADVGLHALTDAVLGALGDGDIGTHFPPSDPQWQGASSDRFLAFAVAKVRARGGALANLDVTILAEAPRIAPHRDVMRRRIAEICDIGVSRVSVKATTSEKLGFIGRAEGIAAYATATIRLPASGDDS